MKRALLLLVAALALASLGCRERRGRLHNRLVARAIVRAYPEFTSNPGRYLKTQGMELLDHLPYGIGK